MHPKLRGAVFVFVTVCLWKLLSPSQLFKFLDYSLNSRDIALPQVMVFFYHHFGTGYEFSYIYYVLWVVQYAEQCFQIVTLQYIGRRRAS